MSYTTPPFIAVRTVAIDGAFHNFMVPLGAGLAYRVVGMSISIIVTATGAHAAAGLYRIQIRDSIPNDVIDDWTGESGAGGSTYHDKIIPEPGLQLQANAGIDMLGISAVAGQSAVIVIYYFQDPIT